MTREEYIIKYGEVDGLRRWKRNEYSKRYQREHPEQRLESVKRWCQGHREEWLEQGKRYYQTHREERLEYSKQYRRAHLEEKLEYDKQRYKRSYQTPYGRAQYLIGGYRRQDHRQNRGECTLTAQWILDNIFNRSCLYCGESDWHRLGCDRIDNAKAHTPNNVVCCCGKCNTKKARMDFLKFAYSMGAKDSDGLIIKY